MLKGFKGRHIYCKSRTKCGFTITDVKYRQLSLWIQFPKMRHLVSTYPLSVLLLWTYGINRWFLNKTRIFAGEGAEHHRVYQRGATSFKFLISYFFAVFWMLYAFFWVIPRRLNFTCWHFGTLCLFHLHTRVGMRNSSYLPAYEDGTECSETSEYKIQTPGNYPEQSIQHSLKFF
jgi:hypothetical protein